MPKRVGKKSEARHSGMPLNTSLEQVYPTIADWSSGHGWVEFGIDGRDRLFVRAMDEGGTVWEGEGKYQTLDEALGALEVGLVEFLEEQAFDRWVGEGREAKKPTASDKKRVSAKAAGPKASPEQAARVKPDAAPSVPRAVVGKVRKFAEIAAALLAGEHFNITRLTGLKSLCNDPEPARAFALFLASAARRKIEEKDVPERYRELMDRAVPEIRTFLDDASQERRQALAALHNEIEQEQNEYRNVPWTQVRMIQSRELLMIENVLKSILRPVEASYWLYQAARDYAERYDSRYGTGLIPSSAPMMQEIAGFWVDYFKIKL